MNRYHRITDFDASRAQAVGSSDIPTLALLNKRYYNDYRVTKDGSIVRLNQTPLTLYQEKRGLIKQIGEKPRAEWGKLLEGLILSKWIKSHHGEDNATEYARYKARGLSYGPYKTMTECTMPDRPYVLAHADLVVEGLKEAAQRVPGIASDYIAVDVPPVIVEAKSCGLMSATRREDGDYGYSRKDFSLGGVPMGVFFQVQWQMLAYNIPYAHVAVLIDTGDYREYEGRADPRTQEKLLALAERFWGLVEAGTPPKPETFSDVALMWPEVLDQTAMVSGEPEMEAREMVRTYHRLAESAKHIEEQKAEIIDALGILMGENKILGTAEGVKLASSWWASSPWSIKAEDMEKSHPRLWGKLVAEGLVTRTRYRRLQPAKLKEE